MKIFVYEVDSKRAKQFEDLMKDPDVMRSSMLDSDDPDGSLVYNEAVKLLESGALPSRTDEAMAKFEEYSGIEPPEEPMPGERPEGMPGEMPGEMPEGMPGEMPEPKPGGRAVAAMQRKLRSKRG